jgi:hypothetical protein
MPEMRANAPRFHLADARTFQVMNDYSACSIATIRSCPTLFPREDGMHQPYPAWLHVCGPVLGVPSTRIDGGRHPQLRFVLCVGECDNDSVPCLWTVVSLACFAFAAGGCLHLRE